jgi:hypothetical protein
LLLEVVEVLLASRVLLASKILPALARGRSWGSIGIAVSIKEEVVLLVMLALDLVLFGL